MLIRSLFVSGVEKVLTLIQWPDSIALVETRLGHVDMGQDHGFTASRPIVIFSWMAHANMLMSQREGESKKNPTIKLFLYIV